MSGIAKPLTHFTGAVTADQSKFVPVDYVESAEPLDVTPVGSNTTQYQILFTLVFPQSGTKNITINFSGASARNNALTNFKGTFSAATTSS